MPDVVRSIDPKKLKQNPDNPRVIFREDELEALRKSIETNGILVPLTVYQDGRAFFILDGERRWTCALKLNLNQVPIIVQPKPDRMRNIMMMFAIHHARRAWDPLPTAYKLQELEKLFRDRFERAPTELELAEIASMSRGEVRRLKKLLQLPAAYREELMEELKKPRSQQKITADHILEATKGVAALRKRDIVDEREEDQLRKVIIEKFRTGVIKNTVAPRKLARLARAVERREVSLETAREVTKRLSKEPKFDVDAAFQLSVEQVDFEHSIEQLIQRLRDRLDEHSHRGYRLSKGLRDALQSLGQQIRRVIGG